MRSYQSKLFRATKYFIPSPPRGEHPFLWLFVFLIPLNLSWASSHARSKNEQWENAHEEKHQTNLSSLLGPYFYLPDSANFSLRFTCTWSGQLAAQDLIDFGGFIIRRDVCSRDSDNFMTSDELDLISRNVPPPETHFAWALFVHFWALRLCERPKFTRVRRVQVRSSIKRKSSASGWKGENFPRIE